MRIRNIFKLKNSADNQQESSEDLLLKALLANTKIDRDKAMTIPAVSSCVDLICNTFAMIPIKLYKEIDKKGRKVEEIIDDIRVKLLNDDTRDTLDAFQFKKALCEDYLMRSRWICLHQKKKK